MSFLQGFDGRFLQGKSAYLQGFSTSIRNPYFTYLSGDAIYVTDVDGDYIYSFGVPGNSNMHIIHDEKFWVISPQSPNGNKVRVYSLDGTYETEYLFYDENDDILQLRGLASGDGGIYTCTRQSTGISGRSEQILKFDTSGNVIFQTEIYEPDPLDLSVKMIKIVNDGSNLYVLLDTGTQNSISKHSISNGSEISSFDIDYGDVLSWSNIFVRDISLTSNALLVSKYFDGTNFEYHALRISKSDSLLFDYDYTSPKAINGFCGGDSKIFVSYSDVVDSVTRLFVDVYDEGDSFLYTFEITEGIIPSHLYVG